MARGLLRSTASRLISALLNFSSSSSIQAQCSLSSLSAQRQLECKESERQGGRRNRRQLRNRGPDIRPAPSIKERSPRRLEGNGKGIQLDDPLRPRRHDLRRKVSSRGKSKGDNHEGRQSPSSEG